MKIEDFRNTTLVVDLGPMLAFWSTLTSKIMGWLKSVTWKKNLQTLSQSDENWQLKKFHQVDLLAYVDLKNDWCLNSVTWCINPFQISSQSDKNWQFQKIWPKLGFWPMLISKIIGAWIQIPLMQMVFIFQVNWMKIEDFRHTVFVYLLTNVDLKIICAWID